jgi:hypothetical protein
VTVETVAPAASPLHRLPSRRASRRPARERTGSSNGDLPPNYADLPNVAHVVASPVNARAGVSNGQYLTGVPGADRARGSSRDNHSDSQDSKSEYADLTVASEFPASVRSSQQYPRPASVKSHSSADDGDDRSANYFEFGGIPSELHQGSPARSSSQQLPGGRAVTSTASSRSGDGERVSTDLPDLVDENESKKQYFDITSGIPSESSHSSSPKSPATAAAATAAPASDSPAQYFDVSQVPIAQESPRTARAMKGKKDGKKSRRKTKDSGSRSGSAEMVAADPQSTSPLAPAPDVANPSAEQPSPLPFNGKDSWMSWGASLSSSTDNIHSPDHCSPYSSRRESNSAFVAPVLSEYVEVDEAIDIANRRASALAYANSCANGAASPASVDDPAFDTPRDILPDPNLALMSRRHTLANSSSGMASPMVHRSQTPLVQSTRMSAGAAAVARTSSGQPRSSTDSSASAGEQSFGQTSLPRSSRESLSGGGSAISRPDSCLSSPSEFWCALLGDRDDQSVSIDFFRSALTRRFGHSTTAPFIDLVKAIFFELCAAPAPLHAGGLVPRARAPR